MVNSLRKIKRGYENIKINYSLISNLLQTIYQLPRLINLISGCINNAPMLSRYQYNFINKKSSGLLRTYLGHIKNFPSRPQCWNVVNTKQFVEIGNTKISRVDNLIQAENVEWS